MENIIVTIYHMQYMGLEYTYYETIFLEANDAFALGNYGLHHLDYTKLISARW